MPPGASRSRPLPCASRTDRARQRVDGGPASVHGGDFDIGSGKEACQVPCCRVLGGPRGQRSEPFVRGTGPALGFACSSPAWREQATLERRPHVRTCAGPCEDRAGRSLRPPQAPQTDRPSHCCRQRCHVRAPPSGDCKWYITIMRQMYLLASTLAYSSPPVSPGRLVDWCPSSLVPTVPCNLEGNVTALRGSSIHNFWL